MKKLIGGILVAFLSVFMMFAPAQAGSTIPWGTGGPTGNYFGMAGDINTYCSELPSGKTFDILDTSGSIENLDGMNSKRFKIGWVQEDVLQFNSKNNSTKVNEKRLKVILAGHPETFHLMVPTNWKPKSEGSFWESWGFGDDPEVAVSLDSLKNQTVGGWGGSLVSLHALNHFAGLNMNIIEIPAAERATPRIPVLLVGGQPYAPAQSMMKSGKYRMLPVVSQVLSDRASFFTPTTASYVVNGKQVNIPTFKVRALLIAKNSRKAERNEDMVYLSQCIQENLADLADDSDTNPNWATIYELNEDDDGDNDVNWKYFD